MHQAPTPTQKKLRVRRLDKSSKAVLTAWATEVERAVKKYQPEYIEEAAKKYNDSKIGTTLVLPGTSGRFDDGCFKSKWLVLHTTHAGQSVQILQDPDTGISRLKWNWDDYIVIQYCRETTWTFTYSTSQVQESTAREDSTPVSHKHTLGFLMGD